MHKLQLKNNGKDNLKSCTINYQSGNKAVGSFVWNGDLAFGKTVKVTLPLYRMGFNRKNV